jgi:transposase InsO family protein
VPEVRGHGVAELRRLKQVEDARRKLEAWRIAYNANRPHSSLGNLAPVEFERRSQKDRITRSKILNL